MPTPNRLTAPRLEHVTLSNFSLYKQRRHIEVDMRKPVFCLAGANGLGKSTFLAALNFGLTGTVAPPNPKYNSMEQYRARALAYSRNYFDGRITEEDREAASIHIDMVVGDKRYQLTRNPFEPEALRSLSIEGQTAGGLPAVDVTDEERDELYRTSLRADIGLTSFAQYVFLQHFLFTFDERRHLLFWDSVSAEKVLYLALGVDPHMAERADQLRKAADGADSLARNAQYDATIATQRLHDIESEASKTAVVGADVESLWAEYEDALAQRDECARTTEQALTRLQDARVALANSSAAELRARLRYESVFNQTMVGRGPAFESHPLVRQALHDSTCAVCGTASDAVLSRVESDIAAKRCPLCGTMHEDANHQTAAFDDLKAADEALAAAKQDLTTAQSRVARLESELARLNGELSTHEGRLRLFEEVDERARLTELRHAKAGLETLTAQYQATISDALDRKAGSLAKRDQALSELKPLRQQLIEAYAEAELRFVPMFEGFAKAFLGLPLTVSLSEGGSARVRLSLSVQGTARRADTQLSESQRYFLDIALRMALMDHMSTVDSPAALYVDTPEGSLDIAYEARAGAMFADYANKGHAIVMTANINTSELLLRLANAAGPQLMHVERMTEWTTLSDVQVLEQNRMDDAFNAIESALASHAGIPSA